MLPDIIIRALRHTVTDIGQLTADEKKALNKYTKLGILDKGKGGPFPMPKTVYAVHGFDFAADRTEQVNQILRIAKMETK